jgi:hypothetical protein
MTIAGIVLLGTVVFILDMAFGLTTHFIFSNDPPIELSDLKSIVVLYFICIVFLVAAIYPTNSRKLRDGPLVIGTVVSAERSFVTVDHKTAFNITVKFSTADGRQITASGQQLFDPNVNHTKQFQPNELIALRHHPENPEQIALLPHV